MLSLWIGVGNILTAVIIGPIRLPLYTEPWPPVRKAPMFSNPVVIVNILLMLIVQSIA
jgi:hypothetical protein